MALEVTRTDGSRKEVMSLGEFKLLCDQMSPASVSPTLTAWYEGQNITAADLCAAMDVDARVAVGPDNGQAHRLIDHIVARIEAACPHVAIPS